MTHKANAEVIQEMADRLAAEFRAEAVILFGSRAWGTPGEASDVDLLVVVSKDEEPPIQRVIRARRALRGFGVPKDILVKTRGELERFATVRASLEHKILAEGKVLYERPED
jgi:predicted nucleotidyltransferase